MWNDISYVLSALGFILAIAANLSAAKSAARLSELQRLVLDSSPSAFQSLKRSHQELSDAVEELAHRVKMIKVRRAADHNDPEQPPKLKKGELPDPFKDPDGWRSAVNAKLGRDRVGL